MISTGTAIKIGLVLGAAGLAAWAGRQAAAAVASLPGKAWDTATAAAHSISPLNNENVIYQTAGRVITGTDEPLGGWLYGKLNPDPLTAWTPPAKAPALNWDTQGGQFNNPSAYTAPETYEQPETPIWWGP